MNWKRWLLGIVATLGVGRDLALRSIEPRLNYDHYEQIAAARSLAAGVGLRVPHGVIDPGPAVVDKPLRSWPPGYSWALTPWLAWTGSPLAAVRLLDAQAAVLFHAAWWVLVLRLFPSSLWAAALTTCWLLLAPPLAKLPPCDGLAAALFSWALVACSFWRRERPWRGALTVGLPLLATVALRFAYWPLALGVPAALAFPERRRLSALLAAVPPALFMLGYLVVARTIDQRLDGGASLHWDHLLRFFPFPASLFNAENRVRLFLPGGAMRFQPLLWIVCAAPALCLFRRPSSDDSPGAALKRIGWASGALVIGLLAIASLTRAWEVSADGNFRWIPIQEPRYYAPLWGLLLLAVVEWTGRVRWRRSVALGYGAFSLAYTGLHEWRHFTPTQTRFADESTVREGRVIGGILAEERGHGRAVVWITPDWSSPREGFAKMAGAGLIGLERWKRERPKPGEARVYGIVPEGTPPSEWGPSAPEWVPQFVSPVEGGAVYRWVAGT